MDLKKQFHKILIFKGILFFLIVIWGGYNQIVASNINDDFSLLDIGGLGFLIFSICYLWSCYSLYNLKKNGREFFLALVFLFVIFGFLAELINPMQFSYDFFYIFVFYIVSPLFPFPKERKDSGLLYCSLVIVLIDALTSWNPPSLIQKTVSPIFIVNSEGL